MKELILDATLKNITNVIDFVNEQLEIYGCAMNNQMQIDIAIEELFGNIANYAYSSNIGKVVIQVEVNDEYVVVTFIDRGVAFNPLMNPEPNITLSADERKVGGLGIFLAKKSVDDKVYEYKDGQNILKIKKFLK